MKVLPAMTISLARVPRREIAPAERYADHTIFQTEPWIKFLEETQAAEPVFAHVLSGRRVIGRFVGLLVTKLGIRILGSPMRGCLLSCGIWWLAAPIASLTNSGFPDPLRSETVAVLRIGAATVALATAEALLRSREQMPPVFASCSGGT
jgi:hypothetical protein